MAAIGSIRLLFKEGPAVCFVASYAAGAYSGAACGPGIVNGFWLIISVWDLSHPLSLG